MEKSGSNFINLIKKKWPWLVLMLILMLGFYLRIYHLDYPVVGYHNWKETHYLTEARNFARDGFFYEGFFMPHSDIPYYNTNENGIHKDSFPTISIILGVFFKLFGYNLWIARFINILFSLGSILFFYLTIKKIFKKESFALVATGILSFLPLFVFFSRQVQLINPSIFFMLLGVYFYLLWLEKRSYKNLLLFSVGITTSIVTKYSFALIVIPMLFIFPFKEIFKKENFKKYLKHMIIIFLIALLIPTWMVYNSRVSDQLGGYSDQEGFFESSQITLPLKSEFWTPMKSYLADNYTFFGLILAAIGLVFLISLRKKNKLGSKFFLGYFLGTIVWLFIMAAKLKGHSYHQYPILPLIAFLISFAILVIAESTASLINNKSKILVKSILIVILVVSLFLVSKNSWQRQFDTQFIGLDVAGDYINKNSDLTERIIHSRHQSFGVVWHANRVGENPPANLTILKNLEERGANWIFMYQWGISQITQNKEVWDYIKENYELKQIAFQTTSNNQPQIVYYLLKKGGKFNEEDLQELIKDKLVKEKTYEFTGGKQTLYYINL